MRNTDDVARYLRDLPLKRAGEEAPAGLWFTSLPWPRVPARAVSLDDRPTWCAPLGQWPGEAPGTPRRLLVAADGGDGPAPPRVSVGDAGAPSAWRPPTAEAECFGVCRETGFMWEQHLMRLRWGGRSIGLAMGLRHAGEVHWWEGCRLVTLEDSPNCRVVEMGGAIPRVQTGIAELTRGDGFLNPWLHHHNWLNGRLYARLHANGVCEIFAHHINSKFVDDGRDLEDVVPVIGIRCEGAEGVADAMAGPWDGGRTEWDFDGVRLDVSEAARLATPGQPGRVSREQGFLVWQPYLGVEVYGGVCPLQRTGDPFIHHAEDRCFPRGMARTLRFSLSLNDQRSPRVERYLPPDWWYGLCEEFSPASLLPAHGPFDQVLDLSRRWIRHHMVRGGFEDGALPRSARRDTDPKTTQRAEAGWEGEVAYAQFLGAWRSGDGGDHADAIRSAYHFTDVAVDHAAKVVRMHGYAAPAISLPMARMLGTIAAYLETGDPYLLETARAVIDNAHWIQKNSWPRTAVGRDACYGRGAAMLYRYFATEHDREIALELARMVAASQRPNGTFGDQAGGTGIHQWGTYITKPWMGLLALGPVLDCLELFPGEEELALCARRFADWLMSARVEREGVRTWCYQHDFNGEARHYDTSLKRWVDLPSDARWHQETLARLMGFCAFHFGEPAYLDAWAESHAAGPSLNDHGVSAALQFLPWLADRLGGAVVEGGAVEIRASRFGPRTPGQVRISGPGGELTVSLTTGERDVDAESQPAHASTA